MSNFKKLAMSVMLTTAIALVTTAPAFAGNRIP
jgi:hypothetical protein